MIDPTTKIIALVATCTYILGFLAVNRYLSAALGASDFSLVKGRYVSIGVWAGIYIGVYGYLPLAGVLVVYQGVVTELSLADLLMVVTFILLTCAVLVQLAYKAIDKDKVSKPQAQKQALKQTLNMYWSCTLLVLLAILFAWFVSFLPTQEIERWSDTFPYPVLDFVVGSAAVFFLFALLLIFTLLGLLTVLDHFSDIVLPQIPVRFGGAQPTEVRLFIDEKAADSLKELEVPGRSSADSGSSQSTARRVQLLWIGDQTYIIRALDNGSVLQVAKSAIISIRRVEDDS